MIETKVLLYNIVISVNGVAQIRGTSYSRGANKREQFIIRVKAKQIKNKIVVSSAYTTFSCFRYDALWQQ